MSTGRYATKAVKQTEFEPIIKNEPKIDSMPYKLQSVNLTSPASIEPIEPFTEEVYSN